jgi:mannose-6-phosphate isomerase-like protein (cupin superfamily)
MDASQSEGSEATVRPGVTLDAAGRPPKRICEFAGRLSSGDADLSIAVMRSPAGWTEPTQVPEFREITAVLEGHLVVHLRDRSIEVGAGESVDVAPGVPVRYETPGPAVYVAVCTPAFSPELVHRADNGGGPSVAGGEGAG